jgi:hypothetical protein
MRPGRKFSSSGSHPLLGGKIERHRAFVAVDAQEIGGVLADEGRAPSSRLVAFARLLDLHHVGAQVTQNHRAQGTR